MGQEFTFIEGISRLVDADASARPGSATIGIGDDCAAWHPSAGHDTLWSTDLLVEGVHFDLSSTSLTDLAHKALAVNLSDIAAMGGVARFVTLSLALPRAPDHYGEFMAAFVAYGRRFDVYLMGGDTSVSPTGLSIGVGIVGEVRAGCAVQRGGAAPGDTVFVTGTLGDSAAGLAILTAGESRIKKTELAELHAWPELVHRHRCPTPRVDAGQMLGRDGLATAMIDLSDGLVADLSHILKASGVGARVEVTSLPMSNALTGWCGDQGEDPVSQALFGGEDYELLFTVAADRVAEVQARVAAGELDATAIGHIEAGSALITCRDGRPVVLEPATFEHRWA